MLPSSFAPGADRDVVADRGMPLAFFFAGSTQSHTLVKRDIVADDGRLADHRAHAVVDEQTPSNLRAGMNLNPGEQARDLRNEPRQKAHAVAPKPVAQVMRPHRVQAGIQDQTTSK